MLSKLKKLTTSSTVGRTQPHREEVVNFFNFDSSTTIMTSTTVTRLLSKAVKPGARSLSNAPQEATRNRSHEPSHSPGIWRHGPWHTGRLSYHREDGLWLHWHHDCHRGQRTRFHARDD